jgi:hypothetical protein
MLKYAAVAIEAGNVNPTQALQRFPLVQMIFEVNSICLYTRKRQLPKPAVDALVNLAAHFAESRPAQVQSGQTPLQELDTLRIRKQLCFLVMLFRTGLLL